MSSMHPKMPRPTRFVSHMREGAAKPAGGDAEATVHLTTPGADEEDKGDQSSEDSATAWS